MRLFSLGRRTPVEELERRSADAHEKKEALAHAVQGLLHVIKEMTLDLAEIGSEDLKAQVDQISRMLRADAVDASYGKALESGRISMVDYADRARGYLIERDAEANRIAQIVRTGVDALSSANQTFNAGVASRVHRLEAVSQLSDLKLLRQSLDREVQQLKVTVQEKQRADNEQVRVLKGEVERLRGDVDQARSEALRDKLTGAGNRGALDQRLQLLVDRRGFEEKPLSLLMLDVDHFKRINDTYGHPIGDRVLVAVVQTCQETVRRDDFIGRYGGEEFAIIMPTADAHVALKVAKRLCKAQRDRGYALDTTAEVRVSVSIGVAEHRRGETMEQLVARADHALYACKGQGRDRALLAP